MIYYRNNGLDETSSREGSSNNSIDTRSLDLSRDIVDTLRQMKSGLEHGRQEILKKREKRQREFDQGKIPSAFPQNIPIKKATAIKSNLPFILNTPVNHTKTILQFMNYLLDSDHKESELLLDFEDCHTLGIKGILQGIQNCKGLLLGDLVYPTSLLSLFPGNMCEKKIWNQIKGKVNSPSADGSVISISFKISDIDDEEVFKHPSSEYFSTTFLELSLICTYLLPILKDENITLSLFLPSIETIQEAIWWQNLLSFLEKEYQIPEDKLKITLQICTYPSFFASYEVAHQLSKNLKAISFDPEGMILSYLKIFRNHKSKSPCNLSSLEKQKVWSKNCITYLSQICDLSQIPLILSTNFFFLQNRIESKDSRLVESIIYDELKTYASFPINQFILYHPNVFDIASSLNKELILSSHPVPIQQTSDQESLEFFFPKSEGPKTISELRYFFKLGLKLIFLFPKCDAFVLSDYGQGTLKNLDLLRWFLWNWNFHKISIDTWGIVSKGFLKKIFEEESEKLYQDGQLRQCGEKEFSLYWQQTKSKCRELLLEDLITDFKFHKYQLKKSLL